MNYVTKKLKRTGSSWLRLKRTGNKAMLSILLLGYAATSTIGINAGLSSLFNPPTTSEIVSKYAKKAWKKTKKEFKKDIKYFPSLVIATLGGMLIKHVAVTIKDDYIVPIYETIKARTTTPFINYIESKKAQKIKAELTDKVNKTSEGQIKISKQDLAIIAKYAESLQQKNTINFDRKELSGILTTINSLEQNTGKTDTEE